MNYRRGSAIKINSEVSFSDLSALTATLKSVTDPNGTEVVTDQSMSFDTVNTSVAFAVWQSLTSSVLGRYNFVTEVTDGSYTDKDEGYFFLYD